MCFTGPGARLRLLVGPCDTLLIQPIAAQSNVTCGKKERIPVNLEIIESFGTFDTS